MFFLSVQMDTGCPEEPDMSLPLPFRLSIRAARGPVCWSHWQQVFYFPDAQLVTRGYGAHRLSLQRRLPLLQVRAKLLGTD